MRVIILGGDGYLGWPTSMSMAAKGHEVWAVDNYLRRTIAQQTSSEALLPMPNLEERAKIFDAEYGKSISTHIFDLTDYHRLAALVEDVKPDCIIHYAEQPSAPYSMRGFNEAKLTFDNNLGATFNTLWAVRELSLIHI